MEIAFTTDVSASIRPDSFRIVKVGGGDVGIGSQTVTNTPQGTVVRLRQLTLAGQPLPDGDYRLEAGPGGVSDTNGSTLPTGYWTAFHLLGGDVNADRIVNFSDLLILAQNYGQTGRGYSQGNLDYSADGLVGFDDLLLLSQRYGSSLVTASPATASRVRRNASPDVLG
jgi:hypothetical protein